MKGKLFERGKSEKKENNEALRDFIQENYRHLVEQAVDLLKSTIVS